MSWKKYGSTAARLVVVVALPVAVIDHYRGLSVVAWGAIVLVGSAVFALGRAVRARRRARGHGALEAGAALATLRAGACVLEGEVAYAAGADRAIRVDFEQVGTESESSSSWSHAWTEVRRKLTVAPFYLVRGDGTRVRVEPTTDQTQLFDELESKIIVPTERTRIRFATLLPGEHVWVTGRLERGSDPEHEGEAVATAYRQPAHALSWIVRGEPLIVSSVSLATHFGGRSRRHLVDAAVLFSLLIVPWALASRYVDRLHGETVGAEVQAVVAETDDDHHVTGYHARAIHEGRRFESESLAFPPRVGNSIAFRVGESSYNTGATARLTPTEAVVSVGFALAVIALRLILQRRSALALPWYRSDKIKVTETGTGRLHS